MSSTKAPKTRSVKVGRVIIGGGFPVSVQTMWKKPLTESGHHDVISSLDRLQAMGCDIVRFAVPDADSAELLGRLARDSPIPLVADIHFDYRLALRCLDFPIAKIRINPGNITEGWKVKKVLEKAAGKGVALRIGVNAGSLPKSLGAEKNLAAAMVKAAEAELELIEKLSFRNVVFSLKSSDVNVTIKANMLFAKKYDFPLHIGVTEAGPLIPGVVKNTLGIAGLLAKGIGNTVRVSLSSSPENEVTAGNEILRAASLRKTGVEMVSCPRCGRSAFDVEKFLEDVSEFIRTIHNPLIIAVMGCAVNGPCEAKRADIGITGAGKSALIFRAGKIIRRVAYDDAVEVFKKEVLKLCAEE